MKEEYLNLIFEMLLKYKLNGSTIVLSESHLDIGWKIADRVALMQDGSIRKVINIKDLKQKYPASSVIVSYSEDQISYQKVFKFEEMGDEQFSQFVRSRLVNDISTISRRLDEIYKFEIGDDLNE
jgi:ABC-type multidrug transport system ATPase subunit